MKLARDQVVQLSRARGEYKGQTVNKGINQPRCGSGFRCAVGIVVRGDRQLLAKYECEVEGQVFVVGQANKEGRRSVGVGRCVWILYKQCLALQAAQKA